MIDPDKTKEMADRFAGINGRFRIFLKKNADPKELDEHFHRLHNEIFYKYDYDCCKCNNCCNLYDIRMEPKDIAAVAGHLGITENDFIEKYLIPDKREFDCLIIKDKPCNFLDSNGKCRIYEYRPSVCRGFPYTNKPDRLYNMLSILDFMEECPVIFEIIEELKKIYNFV